MREHLGVDVDAMYEEELMASDPVEEEENIEVWDPDQQQKLQEESGITRIAKGRKHTPLRNVLGDAMDAVHQGISSRRSMTFT